MTTVFQNLPALQGVAKSDFFTGDLAKKISSFNERATKWHNDVQALEQALEGNGLDPFEATPKEIRTRREAIEEEQLRLAREMARLFELRPQLLQESLPGIEKARREAQATLEKARDKVRESLIAAGYGPEDTEQGRRHFEHQINQSTALHEPQRVAGELEHTLQAVGRESRRAGEDVEAPLGALRRLIEQMIS